MNDYLRLVRRCGACGKDYVLEPGGPAWSYRCPDCYNQLAACAPPDRAARKEQERNRAALTGCGRRTDEVNFLTNG